jgi:hypothetical protein
VALGTQAECLDTDDQLLGGEGIQSCAKVTLDLDSCANDVGNCAKCVNEL